MTNFETVSAAEMYPERDGTEELKAIYFDGEHFPPAHGRRGDTDPEPIEHEDWDPQF
jgi:hypothetical protein